MSDFDLGGVTFQAGRSSGSRFGRSCSQSMHFVSVQFVAELLEIDVEDAQLLGDEIGVPSDDEWDADAIDEARELLEDDLDESALDEEDDE